MGSMKMKTKRRPAEKMMRALLVAALVFPLMLLPATAFATEDRQDGEITAFAAGDYNAGDIAAINAIISGNGLAWTPASPADGSYVPADWLATWSPASTNKRIIQLDLDNSSLAGALDVSGLIALELLACNNNQLAALDVSGLIALRNLQCNSNQLAELDVSGLSALETLLCVNNRLTRLDVSGIALFTLDCSVNQLAELNVSGSLKVLSCMYNQLAELNVSGLSLLQDFNCSYNQLGALDLTGVTALMNFDGSNQALAPTLAGGAGSYRGAVAMNANTIFGSAALSYSGGTLTSTSNAVAASTFTSDLGTAKSLSGTLSLAYTTLSGDAGLVSVAGQAATAGAGAGTAGAPKTAGVTVSNSTTSITLADIVAATGATAHIYPGSGFSANEDSAIGLNIGTNHIYIKVTAQDGATILYYDVTVTRLPGDAGPAPAAGQAVTAGAPKTGDGNNVALLLTICIASLLCLIASAYARRTR
ncbi:MAG: cadherin-like beta sandwich domain-containing protein [Clostridiales Family XIII bacterium]|nr:cadherin-like beta sandwich domain-containing protein [Clostridiales Family XIII bacterium]